MENNDVRHDGKTFEFLGNKVIHYQHHAHFLNVCLSLQTIPKGLQIKKTPCICVTDNTFLEGWKSILKDAELTLMHELKEKNNTIYSELHNDFFRKIN